MSLIEDILANEYLRSLIIFIGTIIIIAISYLVLKLIIKVRTGRKKRYADFILKQLSKPLLFLILCSGLYSSIKPLSLLSLYILWIDSVFFVIIILLSALLASRIITVLMLGYLKVRKGFDKTPQLLNKIIVMIIFVIAFVIILEYFKIDITPLVAGVGLGALAIGLALQSTLSNFFAGMHLISDRPINVGDFIELDQDNSGTVEDIGWRSTRIRTLTDNLLIIPNAKLADSNIINYSLPNQEMSFYIPCGVAYESDLKRVKKVTLEVAKEIQQNTDGAVKDFEPMFRYKEFGDSNINFNVIIRVEEPTKRFTVRDEFIIALKERYDKEKIEISWPVRKLYNIK